MTSNAGSERKGGSIGFGKEKGDATREKVMKALSDFLRPEFIGRVDEVAVFNSLTNEDYVKIAELLLTELKDALEEKVIDFKWTEDV
jgi:ATP-dependent Clp protease ATP-binding subunit ClpA